MFKAIAKTRCGRHGTLDHSLHSLDNVHSAKPQDFCERATYLSSAIQNRIEIGTIDCITLREKPLTSFPLDCGSKQLKNVIIVKYMRVPPQTAGEWNRSYLVIILGCHARPSTLTPMQDQTTPAIVSSANAQNERNLRMPPTSLQRTATDRDHPMAESAVILPPVELELTPLRFDTRTMPCCRRHG
jgi:hypothetical protein